MKLHPVDDLPEGRKPSNNLTCERVSPSPCFGEVSYSPALDMNVCMQHHIDKSRRENGKLEMETANAHKEAARLRKAVMIADVLDKLQIDLSTVEERLWVQRDDVRKQVEKAAGVKPGSRETWELALDLLAQRINMRLGR